MTASILFSLFAVTLVVFIVWRWTDIRAEAAIWTRLAARQPTDPTRFDPAMIADLPEPAQRYFLFAIEPGTTLYTVAEISMRGEFSLGSKAQPSYLPMQAEQILSAPHGFVWKLNAGEGLKQISGSDVAEDSNSWSRFWLLGIAPVARAGGNPDHLRSAFGRCVAEAVFWTPAALLPGDNVRWSSVDESTARVKLINGSLEQAVDLTVDADGKVRKVVFQRWSDANSEKQFQLQPFGGYLSDYKAFRGFRLPTTIEAGNFFDTDEYFPFFKVRVTTICFPTPYER